MANSRAKLIYQPWPGGGGRRRRGTTNGYESVIFQSRYTQRFTPSRAFVLSINRISSSLLPREFLIAFAALVRLASAQFIRSCAETWREFYARHESLTSPCENDPLPLNLIISACTIYLWDVNVNRRLLRGFIFLELYSYCKTRFHITGKIKIRIMFMNIR